jgi:hypothetical protein
MPNVISARLVTLAAGSPAGKADGPALDPLELALNASPIVMLVMVMLAGMSLACWFIIGA